MQVDIERIEQGLLAINNLWVLPIQIAISMVLLFNEVSYAMFAGLVSISLILILNHYISIVQKSATDDTMIWKDKRMKLSSEVFNSILNIKFNAWEDNFLQKILDLRLEELKHVWRFLFIAAINVYLLWMAPYVVSVSTITFYTRILHYDVSAAKIFTALALFRMLQDPLRQLPNCITQLYQAISSIERLDKFYQAREKVLIDSILQLPCGAISIPESNFEWYETMDLVQGGEKQIIPKFVDASHTSKWWNILNKGLNSSKQRYSKVLDDSTHDVEEQDKVELRVLSSNSERSAIEDNSLSKTDSSIQSPLGHSRFILRLPQYKIQPGDLVFIKGKIGSGKSSFLSAILGEMYASNYPATIYPSSSNIYSSIKILGSNSSVSYASQQAWIQHMTVKENILFESAYNETRYQRVVDACALIDDFLELPNYDETMIGEKGLNLSGGQKARIALARAVYANSDIILLDDVLAALDPKVGNKVFQKCILELLRGKTRLIVSHNEELWKHQGINVLITFGSDEEQVHIARHSSASDKPAISSPTAFSKSVSIDDVEYIMSSKYLPRQCIPGYFDSETVGNIDLSTGPRDLSYKKNYSFVGNHSDHDSSISEMLYSKSKNKSDNRQTMTYEEDRSYGAVNSQVYKSYIDAMGGWRIVGFLCIVQSVWQCLSVSSDIYLSHWSKENDVQQERYLDQNLVIYSVLTLGSGLVVLVRTMTVSTAGYYAAKSLFERMLGSLINAPSNWLDRNPSGRLLNRMSDDQAKVDCALPFAFGSVFATGFSLAGDLLAVMGITRYLVIVMIPIGYIYSRLTAIYLRCSRDIQRLMSLSQSPILTYISEISDGLVVVRAMGSKAIEFVTVRNQNLVDENCRMAHLVMASSCWFTLRIQVTGTIILFFIIIISFSCKSFISPGLLGLSISYGLSLSNSLQSLIFNVAWFENSMICPERIVEYINIPQEGTPSQKSLFLEDAAEDVVDMSKGIKNNINNVEKIDRESQSSSSWSPHGSIRYDQVRFRYQPGNTISSLHCIDIQNLTNLFFLGGELVLKNVSFNIPAGSKVGVVGRTGSGKSSLIMSLFRIAELSGGAIYIDGINIQIIQLKVLRSNIEIIPQNPVLFKGRLRLCLDPLQRFSDHDIWNAMKKSSLDTVLFNTDSNREGGSKVRFVSNYLEYELAENGGNLSVGERQMVVLTRAILNGAKVRTISISFQGHNLISCFL